MSFAAETEQREPADVTGLAFDPVSYCLPMSDTMDGRKEVDWRVEVRPDGHMISRRVWRDGKPWDQCDQPWEPESVIWPAWPAKTRDEADAAGSPLAGVEKYWTTVGNRLRDSAKWMATVLGAALAAVAGTSPLAG